MDQDDDHQHSAVGLADNAQHSHQHHAQGGRPAEGRLAPNSRVAAGAASQRCNHPSQRAFSVVRLADDSALVDVRHTIEERVRGLWRAPVEGSLWCAFCSTENKRRNLRRYTCNSSGTVDLFIEHRLLLISIAVTTSMKEIALIKNVREWQLHLDGSDGGHLAGWAWEPMAPDRAVVLEVTSSTGKKIRAVADFFRVDLQEAGQGNGRHAFHIDISDWELGGSVVRIYPAEEGGEHYGISIEYDLALDLAKQNWLVHLDSVANPLFKLPFFQ
jgi:hypothetical protein